MNTINMKGLTPTMRELAEARYELAVLEQKNRRNCRKLQEIEALERKADAIERKTEAIERNIESMTQDLNQICADYAALLLQQDNVSLKEIQERTHLSSETVQRIQQFLDPCSKR